MRFDATPNWQQNPDDDDNFEIYIRCRDEKECLGKDSRAKTERVETVKSL